ncbi:MAG: SDR family oxidoreductase, partial [Enterococcus hulanensis]
MTEEKKTAFVTGAAGGLGTAVVAKLLDQDFTVLANDKNAADVEALLKQFPQNDIHAYCFDATEEEAWKNAAADIKKKHGKIDVLFN